LLHKYRPITDLLTIVAYYLADARLSKEPTES
jgi:hypothetical protein